MPMYIVVFGNTPSSSNKGEKPPPVKGKFTYSGRDSKNTDGEPSEASASGSESNQPDDVQESFLSDGISLIDQLDLLLETFDGVLNLTVDLDDTLLPSNKDLRAKQASLRQAFKDFVEKWRAKGKYLGI